MAAKDKYQLAGLRFQTKKQVQDKARELFGEWKPNRPPLAGLARDFFLSLLSHHDEWTKKLQKLKPEQVDLQPEYLTPYQTGKGSYGIRLVDRNSGIKFDDISWVYACRCLEPNI